MKPTMHAEQNKLATKEYVPYDSFIGNSTILTSGWFCPSSGVVFGNVWNSFQLTQMGIGYWHWVRRGQGGC